jgi:hypothetical protein
MRSMNKRGRLVAERLAYGEAMVGDADETAEWVEDGHAILAELRAAMHGEIDPRSVEEARVRHWQKYGRGIEAIAVGMGRPALNTWLGENRAMVRKIARPDPADGGELERR